MEDRLKPPHDKWLKAALVAIIPCFGMGLLLFIGIGRRLFEISSCQFIGLLLVNILVIPFLANLLIPVAYNIRWALIITIPTICILFLFILIKSYSISFDSQGKLTDLWYFIAMNFFEGPIIALLILFPLSLAGWCGAFLNRKITRKYRN